jgi:sporulation protein YlmC with PRC-barrel domain
MRNASAALLAAVFTLGTAQAQEAQRADSPPIEAGTSVAGIDDAALARSARASKVIGAKVYNGDTAIGQIEDILVDFDNAHVPALVLSVGGFLGLGNKLVAVPANQIKVGHEARFTSSLTKGQLANAPAFNFGKLK